MVGVRVEAYEEAIRCGTEATSDGAFHILYTQLTLPNTTTAREDARSG